MCVFLPAVTTVYKARERPMSTVVEMIAFLVSLGPAVECLVIA